MIIVPLLVIYMMGVALAIALGMFYSWHPVTVLICSYVFAIVCFLGFVFFSPIPKDRK